MHYIFYQNNIYEYNYIILEELGRGLYGIVYKVTNIIDNKYYALKFEKIIDTDITDKHSHIQREIKFYNDFGNEYPLYFTKYYGCYYENKNMLLSCDKIDIKINVDDYNDIVKIYLEKHKKSNIYLSRIYDLIDISLDKIINKLNKKQLYSMIIQVTNIIKLLHNNNYIHGDLHINNIGIKYTNIKYININNIQIPTYGYIYKLIDLSFVINNNDIQNNYEKNIYNNIFCYEYLNLLNYLIYIPDNLYIYNTFGFQNNNKNIIDINDRYNKLIDNKSINNRLTDDKLINNIYSTLYLYYLKIYKTNIPKPDILFIINNNHEYDKIINYMTNKIYMKNNINFKLYILILCIIFIIFFLEINKYIIKYFITY